MICLIRIYHGDVYNETFDETKEVQNEIILSKLIHRLAALYDDLSTLFEFYFTENLIIENQSYTSVVKIILNYAQMKVESRDNHHQVDQIEDSITDCESRTLMEIA